MSQAAGQPRFPTPEAITGANIVESSVQRTLTVTPGKGPYPTLLAGFEASQNLLAKGTSVKLKIRPGTYRESVLGLNWREGKAADTLFIIEGEGKVIWTGSDVFPLSEWTKDDGLLEHPWPHKFGSFAWSWGPKGLIGHRSEMAFLNGRPLRPRVLEQEEIAGIEQNPDVINQVIYRPKGALDPHYTLKEGEFGVFEREENRPRVVVRPPSGESLSVASIEVSVRRQLLELDGKNQLVLRGIIFQNTANSDREYGHLNAVTFGGHRGRPSKNVLIEKCQFLWNAMTGLSIIGDNWTLRDCVFRGNGFSGLATGKCQNVIWENLDTCFNVWRAWRGGELGYFTGGFKAHEVNGHLIKGHLALGNCTMGAWWDIHCHDVFAEDLIAVGNAANVQWEISNGPLKATRWLIAGGKTDEQIRFWEHGETLLRDSIIYSNYKGSGRSTLYSLRWFGRDDPHSRMFKLKAGVNRVEDCVFLAGPNVPNYSMLDDIRGQEWSAKEPLIYRGLRNIIFRPDDPGFSSRWIKDGGRTGDLAARAMEVSVWLTEPFYTELEPKSFDPGFVNPSGYDFTLKPSSPLRSSPRRYPEFKLSPSLKKEWDWFTKWSGYQPEVWNEPTGD